jgi:tRNA-specific 2-thiouridylase
MHGSNRRNRGKVVVAMSGGVDSSVAAALLKQDGYRVVGCFMRLGSDDSVEAAEGYDNVRDDACDPAKVKVGHQGCCSVSDASDARLVAAMLDVPFYVLNFKRDFARIIDYFVDEYNAGRTPNPCVRCNDWLKFGKLHDYARSIDADFVASGHYARVRGSDDVALLRGVDHGKDQSYVLFGTPRDRLRHLLLPIGDMQKDEVRQRAEAFNLPVFDKPDSQEICFVPDNDYARLVRRRSPGRVAPGHVLDTQGNVVGEHPGQQHFTIGQRRGIGVALGYPIYVVDKDPRANTVTVGSRQELLASGCAASQTNWLVPDADIPAAWTPCLAKVRYNSRPVPARVRATGADTLEVGFDEPIPAVTPGQAVVIYDADRVLGGGWIDHVNRADRDAKRMPPTMPAAEPG